jgi:5-formyltetrahydrofolate cyclo-ligase
MAPNARMARGLWNIPYSAETAEVVPTLVLAPLVGFDQDCFRLGYGRGFFDRTLARFPTKPLMIGVGYPSALIRTIYPQPHDMPLDWIVTGATPPLRRSVGKSQAGACFINRKAGGQSTAGTSCSVPCLRYIHGPER